MNTWAIQQTTASSVSLYYCLQALMIALLAWLLLGEQLSGRVAIGGLLIMAGLCTVTWALERKRRKEQPKQRQKEKYQPLQLMEDQEQQLEASSLMSQPSLREVAETDTPSNVYHRTKSTAEYGTFV